MLLLGGSGQHLAAWHVCRLNSRHFQKAAKEPGMELRTCCKPTEEASFVKEVNKKHKDLLILSRIDNRQFNNQPQ